MQPYAAGTKVEKINSDPSDMHQDGALGRIVRHLAHSYTKLAYGEVIKTHEYGYFVLWDDFPFAPVFICGCRLREVI